VKGFNNVQLIGNLGNTPELRYTGAGLPITSASLAVNGARRSPVGEVEDSTEWFRLVFFGREAEKMARFGTKGGSVFVMGQLQTRPYADRNGVVRTAIEVVVDYCQLLSGHTEHEPTNLGRYDSDSDTGYGPPPPGIAPPMSDEKPIKVREHMRARPYAVDGTPVYGPLEATVVNAPLPAPRARRGGRK
jgi:single-strand DNA-binding protein